MGCMFFIWRAAAQIGHRPLEAILIRHEVSSSPTAGSSTELVPVDAQQETSSVMIDVDAVCVCDHNGCLDFPTEGSACLFISQSGGTTLQNRNDVNGLI